MCKCLYLLFKSLVEFHKCKCLSTYDDDQHCSSVALVFFGMKELASSYLRSASSAMCLASFSWISCSSIFSSSFMALFSMTFMPLWDGKKTVKSLLRSITYETASSLLATQRRQLINLEKSAEFVLFGDKR